MITTNKDTLQNPSLDFTGTNDELKNLISVLEFELASNKNQKGVGLSAIQINIPFKVSIIRHDKVAINLANARIVKQEQPFIFKGEMCLSLPNQSCDTKRFNIIEVLNGDGKLLKISGFDAVIIQHELAHWDGKTIFDYAV